MKTRRPMMMRLGLLAALAVIAVLVVVVVTTPRQDELRRRERRRHAGRPVRARRHPAVRASRSAPPDAPVTLVEFADLQCPFCAEYERSVLPALLDRYVRTGKVRLELRLLRFLGPDSDRLARVAAAASERTGCGSSSRSPMSARAPRTRAMPPPASSTGSPPTPVSGTSTPAPPRSSRFASSEQAARRSAIESTPSFLIGPTGGDAQRFQPADLTPEAFEPQIEKALGR